MFLVSQKLVTNKFDGAVLDFHTCSDGHFKGKTQADDLQSRPSKNIKLSAIDINHSAHT